MNFSSLSLKDLIVSTHYEDNPWVLYAEINPLPKTLSTEQPFEVSGVVVLSGSAPEGCRMIIVGDELQQDNLKWGIKSPRMREKYPQGSNCDKARFQIHDLRIPRNKSVEIYLEDGAGERRALFSISAAGFKLEPAPASLAPAPLIARIQDCPLSTNREGDAAAAPYLFLVLAHSDPKHLVRLVEALKHPRVHVLIHIDGKVLLNDFVEPLKRCTNGNISLTLDRFPVEWGGFGMVEAMLALLRGGLSFPSATRFCYLSGSDYPLRPVDEVVSFLNANPDADFVECLESPDDGIFGLRHLRPHIDGMVPFLNTRHRKHGVEQDLARSLRKPLKALFLEQGAKPMKAHRPFAVFYKGSQWMSLTRASAEALLKQYDSIPEIGAFFRYTGVPDESMLQTMLMNSPLRGRVQNRSLHYISRKQKEETPFHEMETLNMRHYDEIAADSGLFARKFATGVSDELLRRIDEMISGRRLPAVG